MLSIQLAFDFGHEDDRIREHITRTQDVFPRVTVDHILNGLGPSVRDLYDTALSQYHPDRDLL